MKKLGILVAIAMCTGTVAAKEVQWSQGYTANCTNATQRVDGTILNATEIAFVKYQIIPVSSTSATYEVIMSGGCRTTFIDTKQFVPVGSYLMHGITVDTDGLESVLSSPGVELIVQKARPKSPSGVQ